MAGSLVVSVISIGADSILQHSDPQYHKNINNYCDHADDDADFVPVYHFFSFLGRPPRRPLARLAAALRGDRIEPSADAATRNGFLATYRA